ncbi:MAG: flagellar hook-basal body complex protein FliE [Pseudomonadota bacterium]|nr:flagellar hook-basal body complex protein FliE [Pseudomonadota bacterium]
MIPAIGSSFATNSTIAPSNTPSVSSGVAPSTGTSSVDFNEFTEVLSRVMVDAVDTMKSAEATSIQGVNGKASTQAVVEAVMSAERTLQTAVAVRDKAVAAYMELSRMAI